MDDITTRIERALKTVRPYLQADDGDVQVLRFREDGILELQWMGTCKICPMSVLTLRAGVERAIMNECPEVKRVEAISGQ